MFFGNQYWTRLPCLHLVLAFLFYGLVNGDNCAKTNHPLGQNGFHFYKFENTSSLKKCINSCCEKDLCELAFLLEQRCFGLACQGKPKICHKIADQLISTSHRRYDNVKQNYRKSGIIEQSIIASSPQCPRPFATSFTFLVSDANRNKKFTILKDDGDVTESQCKGLCCQSPHCDFAFVEEGTCFGVSFLSSKNFVAKATVKRTRKYLQMAIIERKQDVVRSVEDTDDDDDDIATDTEDDPDNLGSEDDDDEKTIHQIEQPQLSPQQDNSANTVNPEARTKLHATPILQNSGGPKGMKSQATEHIKTYSKKSNLAHPSSSARGFTHELKNESTSFKTYTRQEMRNESNKTLHEDDRSSVGKASHSVGNPVHKPNPVTTSQKQQIRNERKNEKHQDSRPSDNNSSSSSVSPGNGIQLSPFATKTTQLDNSYKPAIRQTDSTTSVSGPSLGPSSSNIYKPTIEQTNASIYPTNSRTMNKKAVPTSSPLRYNKNNKDHFIKSVSSLNASKRLHPPLLEKHSGDSESNNKTTRQTGSTMPFVSAAPLSNTNEVQPNAYDSHNNNNSDSQSHYTLFSGGKRLRDDQSHFSTSNEQGRTLNTVTTNAKAPYSKPTTTSSFVTPRARTSNHLTSPMVASTNNNKYSVQESTADDNEKPISRKIIVHFSSTKTTPHHSNTVNTQSPLNSALKETRPEKTNTNKRTSPPITAFNKTFLTFTSNDKGKISAKTVSKTAVNNGSFALTNADKHASVRPINDDQTTNAKSNLTNIPLEPLNNETSYSGSTITKTHKHDEKKISKKTKTADVTHSYEINDVSTDQSKDNQNLTSKTSTKINLNADYNHADHRPHQYKADLSFSKSSKIHSVTKSQRLRPTIKRDTEYVSSKRNNIAPKPEVNIKSKKQSSTSQRLGNNVSRGASTPFNLQSATSNQTAVKKAEMNSGTSLIKEDRKTTSDKQNPSMTSHTFDGEMIDGTQHTAIEKKVVEDAPRINDGVKAKPNKDQKTKSNEKISVQRKEVELKPFDSVEDTVDPDDIGTDDQEDEKIHIKPSFSVDDKKHDQSLDSTRIKLNETKSLKKAQQDKTTGSISNREYKLENDANEIGTADDDNKKSHSETIVAGDGTKQDRPLDSASTKLKETKPPPKAQTDKLPGFISNIKHKMNTDVDPESERTEVVKSDIQPNNSQHNINEPILPLHPAMIQQTEHKMESNIAADDIKADEVDEVDKDKHQQKPGASKQKKANLTSPNKIFDAYPRRKLNRDDVHLLKVKTLSILKKDEEHDDSDELGDDDEDSKHETRQGNLKNNNGPFQSITPSKLPNSKATNARDKDLSKSKPTVLKTNSKIVGKDDPDEFGADDGELEARKDKSESTAPTKVNPIAANTSKTSYSNKTDHTLSSKPAVSKTHSTIVTDNDAHEVGADGDDLMKKSKSNAQEEPRVLSNSSPSHTNKTKPRGKQVLQSKQDIFTTNFKIATQDDPDDVGADDDDDIQAHAQEGIKVKDTIEVKPVRFEAIQEKNSSDKTPSQQGHLPSNLKKNESKVLMLNPSKMTTMTLSSFPHTTPKPYVVQKPAKLQANTKGHENQKVHMPPKEKNLNKSKNVLSAKSTTKTFPFIPKSANKSSLSINAHGKIAKASATLLLKVQHEQLKNSSKQNSNHTQSVRKENVLKNVNYQSNHLKATNINALKHKSATLQPVKHTGINVQPTKASTKTKSKLTQNEFLKQKGKKRKKDKHISNVVSGQHAITMKKHISKRVPSNAVHKQSRNHPKQAKTKKHVLKVSKAQKSSKKTKDDSSSKRQHSIINTKKNKSYYANSLNANIQHQSKLANKGITPQAHSKKSKLDQKKGLKQKPLSTKVSSQKSKKQKQANVFKSKSVAKDKSESITVNKKTFPTAEYAIPVMHRHSSSSINRDLMLNAKSHKIASAHQSKIPTTAARNSTLINKMAVTKRVVKAIPASQQKGHFEGIQKRRKGTKTHFFNTGREKTTGYALEEKGENSAFANHDATAENVQSSTKAMHETRSSKHFNVAAPTASAPPVTANNNSTISNTTSKSILRHFVQVPNVQDSVQFSSESHKKKHKKSKHHHVGHVHAEDIGDSDFDILMSNDIPHKKKHKHENSEKKSKKTSKKKHKKVFVGEDVSGEDNDKKHKKKKSKKKKKHSKDVPWYKGHIKYIKKVKNGDDSGDGRTNTNHRHVKHHHKPTPSRHHRHRTTPSADDKDDNDDDDDDDHKKPDRPTPTPSHHHRHHHTTPSGDDKDDDNDDENKKSTHPTPPHHHHHHTTPSDDDNNDDDDDDNKPVHPHPIHHRHQKKLQKSDDDDNDNGEEGDRKKVKYYRHPRPKPKKPKYEDSSDDTSSENERSYHKHHHVKYFHRHDDRNDEYEERHKPYHKKEEYDERHHDHRHFHRKHYEEEEGDRKMDRKPFHRKTYDDEQRNDNDDKHRNDEDYPHPRHFHHVIKSHHFKRPKSRVFIGEDSDDESDSSSDDHRNGKYKKKDHFMRDYKKWLKHMKKEAHKHFDNHDDYHSEWNQKNKETERPVPPYEHGKHFENDDEYKRLHGHQDWDKYKWKKEHAQHEWKDDESKPWQGHQWKDKSDYENHHDGEHEDRYHYEQEPSRDDENHERHSWKSNAHDNKEELHHPWENGNHEGRHEEKWRPPWEQSDHWKENHHGFHGDDSRDWMNKHQWDTSEPHSTTPWPMNTETTPNYVNNPYHQSTPPYKPPWSSSPQPFHPTQSTWNRPGQEQQNNPWNAYNNGRNMPVNTTQSNMNINPQPTPAMQTWATSSFPLQQQASPYQNYIQNQTHPQWPNNGGSPNQNIHRDVIPNPARFQPQVNIQPGNVPSNVRNNQPITNNIAPTKNLNTLKGFFNNENTRSQGAANTPGIVGAGVSPQQSRPQPLQPAPVSNAQPLGGSLPAQIQKQPPLPPLQQPPLQQQQPQVAQQPQTLPPAPAPAVSQGQPQQTPQQNAGPPPQPPATPPPQPPPPPPPPPTSATTKPSSPTTHSTKPTTKVTTTNPTTKTTQRTTTAKRTTVKPTEEDIPIPPPADLDDIDGLIGEQGGKQRKHRDPKCKAGTITDDMTLMQGRRAGNFTKIGDIGDFELCIKRCCQTKSCDLAYKTGENCYLVHCKSKDTCQVTPALIKQYSPKMSFVRRTEPEEEDDQQDDDNDGKINTDDTDKPDKNDKLSPAGIHEVCKSEKALAINWKKTSAGRYATVPCPRHAKGNARRRCGPDSRWQNPDFSQCVTNDYMNIHKKSHKLAIGADARPLIRDLSQLTTQTLDNSLIFGGDLLKSAEVMSAVVQHNGQNDLLEMDRQDMQNFITTSSNLLDLTNKQEWFNVQQSKAGSADILRSMEMFSLQAAMRLPRDGMRKPFVTNNIMLKLDRRSPRSGRLTFPDYTDDQISKWDVRHDVISIPSSVFKAGEVSAASISFKSLPFILPDVNSSSGIGPNSKILTTLLHPAPPDEISPPVTIILSHIKPRRDNTKCVFWDYNITPHRGGGWSTRGCKLVSSNHSHSVCQCNHLSNFAVLADISDDQISAKEQKRERTMALMWIGIPVLVVGLIGALYMSFSWTGKSHLSTSMNRPIDEKTGLLGQRVVTSKIREEFPASPSRHLYRALSPAYTPRPKDLEWQDEFRYDMGTVLGDKFSRKLHLPQLEVTSRMLDMFDKQVNKKTILEEENLNHNSDDTYSEINECPTSPSIISSMDSGYLSMSSLSLLSSSPSSPATSHSRNTLLSTPTLSSSLVPPPPIASSPSFLPSSSLLPSLSSLPLSSPSLPSSLSSPSLPSSLSSPSLPSSLASPSSGLMVDIERLALMPPLHRQLPSLASSYLSLSSSLLSSSSSSSSSLPYEARHLYLELPSPSSIKETDSNYIQDLEPENSGYTQCSIKFDSSTSLCPPAPPPTPSGPMLPWQWTAVRTSPVTQRTRLQRVRFADEPAIIRRQDDDERTAFERLMKLERQVFPQRLKRCQAMCKLDVDERLDDNF